MNESVFYQQLKQKLSFCYVISTDETLLGVEAKDAIRARARLEGFTEKLNLNVERSFDWGQVRQGMTEISLFGDRKFIELTISSGKPGKDGVDFLNQLSKLINPDVVLVILLPRLDAATKKLAWVLNLQKISSWVDIPTLSREELPDWLQKRCAASGYRLSKEGLNLLVGRTEGNLMAAKQELQKLMLLNPPGELSVEQIQMSVMDVARYDPFKLYFPLLKRDHGRLLRMLQGLEAEGTALPQVVWLVSDEIRNLLTLKQAATANFPLSQLMRELRIWGEKEVLINAELQYFHINVLKACLANLLEVDKLSKGLKSIRFSGSPWVVLQHILLRAIT